MEYRVEARKNKSEPWRLLSTIPIKKIKYRHKTEAEAYRNKDKWEALLDGEEVRVEFVGGKL